MDQAQALAHAARFKKQLQKKAGAPATDKRTCYELIAAAGTDTRHEPELHMACQVIDDLLLAMAPESPQLGDSP
jgi:hypothetical protein